MKLLLTILVSVMLLCFDGGKIEWSEQEHLTWDNFKGKPKISSKHSAISGVGILYDYKKVKTGELELKIVALFDKNISWVNPNDKAEYLLSHEQLHFDIVELYARKMRKSVKEDITVNVKNVNRVFKQIYQKNNNQKDIRQELYDNETDRSKDKQEQSRWAKMIKQELTELSAYKETIIIIR